MSPKVEVVCMTDHTSTGGTTPPHVMGTFDSMQEASNRGFEESYPNCTLDYRLLANPVGETK